MSCTLMVRGFLVTVAAFGMANLAYAEAAWTLYDMSVMPTTLDLDGNKVDDWSVNITAGQGSITTDGDVLTIIGTKAGGSAYLSAEADDQIWHNKFAYADGYTVEYRAKVISQEAGTSSAIALVGGTADGPSDAGMQWGPKTTGINWVAGWDDSTLAADLDNTDTFHTFRVAQLPGQSKYNVWRDGVLVGNGVAGANDNPNLAYFGDGSSIWGGEVQVDYFKFTPQYVPEPSTLVLASVCLISLLAYAWRKRR